MDKARAQQTRYLRLDPAAGRFLVNRAAFTDPKVFEEEKTKLLKRSWIFLGWLSEDGKAGGDPDGDAAVAGNRDGGGIPEGRL